MRYQPHLPLPLPTRAGVQWKPAGANGAARAAACKVATTACVCVQRGGRQVAKLTDFTGAGCSLGATQRRLPEADQLSIKIQRLQRKVHHALAAYMHTVGDDGDAGEAVSAVAGASGNETGTAGARAGAGARTGCAHACSAFGFDSFHLARSIVMAKATVHDRRQSTSL